MPYRGGSCNWKGEGIPTRTLRYNNKGSEEFMS